MNKIVKTVSAVLCTLLILAMLAGMFLPLFAEEAEPLRFTGEDGVMLTVAPDLLSSDFADVSFEAHFTPLREGDTEHEGSYNAIKSALPEGYALDSAYFYAIVTAEDYPQYDAEAGTVINPALFEKSPTLWLPLTETQQGYKELQLFVITYTYESALVEGESRTYGGAEYLTTEGSGYGYIALCHAVDESGAPLLLQWYEKGAVGAVWSFVRNFWGLLVLLTAAVVITVFMFRPLRSRKPASEAPEDAEAAGEAPAEEIGEAPEDKAAGEAPADEAGEAPEGTEAAGEAPAKETGEAPENKAAGEVTEGEAARELSADETGKEAGDESK